MRTEFKEVLQSHLDDLVIEVRNNKAKGDSFACPNPDLAFQRGYIFGMCYALNCTCENDGDNCTFENEGDTWYIKDGRGEVIAKATV